MQRLIEITGNVKIGHPLSINGNVYLNVPVFISGEVIVGIDSTHETYQGEYEVIPKVYEQILETDDMLMADDVTVREITFNLVSNEKGLTAQIGEV